MSNINTSQNRSPQEPKQNTTGLYVKGFTLIFFCLVTLFALSGAGYGRLNELWANTLRWMFGTGSYLLALLLGIQGLFVLSARSLRTYLSWGQLLALELLFLCMLAIWTLSHNDTLLLHTDMLKSSGGLLGWTIAFFASLFGTTLGKALLYLCMLLLLPPIFKLPLMRLKAMLTNQQQKISDWQISLQSPISSPSPFTEDKASESGIPTYSSAKTADRSNRSTRPLTNQSPTMQGSTVTRVPTSTVRPADSRRRATESSYSPSTITTRPLSKGVAYDVGPPERGYQAPLQTQNRAATSPRAQHKPVSATRRPTSASQPPVSAARQPVSTTRPSARQSPRGASLASHSPISAARSSTSTAQQPTIQPPRGPSQAKTPSTSTQSPTRQPPRTPSPQISTTRSSVASQPKAYSRSTSVTQSPISAPQSPISKTRSSTRASQTPISTGKQPAALQPEIPSQPVSRAKSSATKRTKPPSQPVSTTRGRAGAGKRTKTPSQPVSTTGGRAGAAKRTKTGSQPVSSAKRSTAKQAKTPSQPVSRAKSPTTKRARRASKPISTTKQAASPTTQTDHEQIPPKSQPVVKKQTRKESVTNQSVVKSAAKTRSTSLPPSQRTSPPPTPQPQAKPVMPDSQPARVSKRKINTVVPVSATNQLRSDDLPPFDILQQRDGKVDPLEAQEKAKLIEETLEDFGVPVTVVEINQGPRITQFGVEPGFIETMQRDGSVKRRKVKVNAIKALSDDLALALAARSIRIQPRVPGRTYVGIELPNDEFETVTLHSLLTSEAYLKIKGDLVIALGRDVTGQPVAADISRMPHMLIAGATGSGKSVCINAIIASLLFNLGPDQLKLLLIDPKMVELVPYNGIPHLNTPVVTNMEKVVGSLSWAVREMERRYSLFSDARKRNLQSYNKWAKGSGHDTLPYIVIIIDELADLMMVAADEVEQIICRLAQMARATGIHLILATQRPSVDVVTGLIKANIPTRISFSVASGTDSRVILDSTGAEDLLGLGDMLYQASDASRLQRIQGCYVSDEELQELVDFWLHAKAKKALSEIFQEKPPSTPIFQDQAQSKVTDKDVKRKEERSDELLAKAIALVEQHQSISISVLQRKLRISYTRAARIIKELKKQGIIGAPKK